MHLKPLPEKLKYAFFGKNFTHQVNINAKLDNNEMKKITSYVDKEP